MASGSVKRMKGRDLWVGRFQLDGKRHAVYGKTAKECGRKLREAYRLAESGVTTARADLTVGRYLDEWLETSVRGKRRPATVKSYEDTVRRGVDVAVVSKALGHSNVSTTADVYSHWTRPMQERTAAVTESVLAPTGS